MKHWRGFINDDFIYLDVKCEHSQFADQESMNPNTNDVVWRVCSTFRQQNIFHHKCDASIELVCEFFLLSRSFVVFGAPSFYFYTPFPFCMIALNMRIISESWLFYSTAKSIMRKCVQHNFFEWTEFRTVQQLQKTSEYQENEVIRQPNRKKHWSSFT